MAVSLGELIFTLGLQDREFNTKLNNSQSKLESFGKRATDVGKTLTTGVTLPLVGLGTAALTMATRAETASRRTQTAFRDITGGTEVLEDAINKLNEEFGLSETQATELLGRTGDLLRGFGATGDQALETSLEVQELATQLSAYNGIPVAEASDAITKALLGETESLKGLGVVIRQTDVDQQVMLNGQEDLTGQARLLARAQATLELATSQSGDAISSFAENQDTAAFQTSALLGDLKDLGVQFGNVLLPVFKDVVGELRDVVDWFSQLDDTAKENIVRAAAIAAAIGPVVLVVGKATTAVKGLSTAMGFLAANPIVAAIAGAAALTVGIVALVEAGDNWVDKQNEIAEAGGRAWREGRVEAMKQAETLEDLTTVIPGLSQEMLDLAHETGNFTLALEEADRAASLESRLNMLRDSMVGTEGQVTKVRMALDDLNQTEPDFWGEGGDEASNFAQAVETLTDENNNLEDSIMKTTTALQQRAIWDAIIAEDSEALKEALNSINGETDEMVELERELAEVRSGGALQEYADEQEKLAEAQAEARRQAEEDSKREQAEAIAEAEALAERQSALSEINSIVEQQKTEYEQVAEQLEKIRAFEAEGVDEENARLQAIDALEARLEELDAAERQRVEERSADLQRRLFEQNATRIELLEAARDKELANVENTEEDRLAIIEFYSGEINAIREEEKAAKMEKLAEEQKAAEEAAEAERDAFLQSIQDRIDAYQEQERERIESEQKISDFNQGVFNDYARLHDNRLFLLEQERIARIEAAEEIGASTVAIEQLYDEERMELIEEINQEQIEAEREKWMEIASITQSYVGSIFSIIDNLHQVQMNNIDAELARKIAALDKEEMSQEEYEEAVVELEKEAELEKWEIQVKAFRAKQAADIISIIIDTAVSIMKAYAQLGPIGGTVAAVILGALGATQIGLVTSQAPPARPQLAEGGIVNPSPGGTDVTIGEGGDAEAVVPLNDEFFNRLSESASASTTAQIKEETKSNMPLNIFIDGIKVAQIDNIQEAVRNGGIQIPASAITEGV